MSTRAPRHAGRSTALDLPARPARSAGAGAFRAAGGRVARVVPRLADPVATRRGRRAPVPARPRYAFLRSRLARALAVSGLAGVALLAAGSASAQTTNADGSETLWEATLVAEDLTYLSEAFTGYSLKTMRGHAFAAYHRSNVVKGDVDLQRGSRHHRHPGAGA